MSVLLSSRRLDEQTKLSEAVQRHLKLQAGQASMHALLQKYVDADRDNLGLLLRQEHRPVSPWLPCLAHCFHPALPVGLHTCCILHLDPTALVKLDGQEVAWSIVMRKYQGWCDCSSSLTLAPAKAADKLQLLIMRPYQQCMRTMCAHFSRCCAFHSCS